MLRSKIHSNYYLYHQQIWIEPLNGIISDFVSSIGKLYKGELYSDMGISRYIH